MVFVFPDELLYIFYFSNNVVGILIGIGLNLYITFDNMDILIMLNLLIQEHSRFLLVLMSLSNSFVNVMSLFDILSV